MRLYCLAPGSGEVAGAAAVHPSGPLSSVNQTPAQTRPPGVTVSDSHGLSSLMIVPVEDSGTSVIPQSRWVLAAAGLAVAVIWAAVVMERKRAAAVVAVCLLFLALMNMSYSFGVVAAFYGRDVGCDVVEVPPYLRRSGHLTFRGGERAEVLTATWRQVLTALLCGQCMPEVATCQRLGGGATCDTEAAETTPEVHTGIAAVAATRMKVVGFPAESGGGSTMPADQIGPAAPVRKPRGRVGGSVVLNRS